MKIFLIACSLDLSFQTYLTVILSPQLILRLKLDSLECSFATDH